MDTVILQKRDNLERCLNQVRRFYAQPSMVPFAEDFMRRDATIHNLQLACEVAIDAAAHTCRVSARLGDPGERSRRR